MCCQPIFRPIFALKLRYGTKMNKSTTRASNMPTTITTIFRNIDLIYDQTAYLLSSYWDKPNRPQIRKMVCLLPAVEHSI